MRKITLYIYIYIELFYIQSNTFDLNKKKIISLYNKTSLKSQL